VAKILGGSETRVFFRFEFRERIFEGIEFVEFLALGGEDVFGRGDLRGRERCAVGGVAGDEARLVSFDFSHVLRAFFFGLGLLAV